jgi:hypothetical protein
MTRKLPPSVSPQPAIEVVDISSDHPDIPTGTFYSLREADTKLAAAYTPRLAREAPVVSYVVSWVDAQLVMRSFPADRAAWTAARRAGGLVRGDVLRTVKSWAEDPTDVARQRRGAMFLRRMEADAARFPTRNAQAAGPGPTLLPDPYAALAQRRDRYAGRRPIAVAPAHLVNSSRRGGASIPGYPETTNADVRYLVNWTSLALTNDLRQLHPDDAGAIWNAWRATVATVESILRLKGAQHDARYQDNEGLWLQQLPGIVALLAEAISARESLRNGLAFQPLGRTGERYPAWVQELRGQSGVYVLRERQADDTMPVVYVGSSVGALYETMTRHLQSWGRGKKFWRGHHTKSGDHDPGLTYDRGTVDAAVLLTDPDDARRVEYETIERLAPRDNLIGQAVPADDGWYSGGDAGHGPHGESVPESYADVPF